MDRRSFLTHAGALPLLPALVARAFAQDPPPPVVVRVGEEPPPPPRPPHLETARALAIRKGKPLLVIVVPPKDATPDGLAADWGDLFRYGDHAFYAALALAEVTTATHAELAPYVDEDARELLAARALLIEWTFPDRDSKEVVHTVRAVDAELAERPFLDWETPEAEAASTMSKRVRPLAEAIVAALAGTPELRERRLRQARAHLHHELWASTAGILDGPLADAEKRSALLDSAALVYERTLGEAGVEARAKLAALEREVVYDHAPPGAWWVESWGCGIDVIDPQPDPDEVWAVDCGMGHSPEGSRRFLYFYDPMADWR